MKKHLWIGILSLAAVAGGCKSTEKNTPTDLFKPVPTNSFVQTWSTDLGIRNGKPTEIFFFDNQIIVYSSSNTAHVVNRLNGQLMFINPLPTGAGAMHAPSVIGDRIVYPATSNYKVYSSKTGRLMNDVNTPYAIRTGGSGLGTEYYIAAEYPNGGRLVKIDLTLTNATPVWEVFTGATMRSAPVAYQGAVFFAAEDGKVRAVSDLRNSIWALDSIDGAYRAGPILTDIRVDESAVYIPSTDTKLIALNRATGMIKWQYYAQTALREKPITTADMLYIPVSGRGLVAISKSEGDYNRKPRWTAYDATQFLADDDKFSYVLLKDRRIAAIDKATGEQKFVTKGNDFGLLASNTKDGLIYATRGGRLSCLKPVTKQGIVGELVLVPHPLEIASR